MAPGENVDGRLVTAGFVDTHVHLDKSCILDRCHSEKGTLQEAIAQVAAAKRAFSEEDVYERWPAHAGRRRSSKAPTRMRTHVGGRSAASGLRSFAAIQRLKRGLRLGDRPRHLRVSAGRLAQ
jgi:cytosine deaminase